MNNNALEHATRKKRRLRGGKFIFLAVLLIVMAGAVIYFLLTSVFVVRNVTVSGMSVYDSEKFISDLNIPEGSPLFFTPFKSRFESVARSYPFITDVSFKVSLPDKLNVSVAENVGCMEIDIGNETYLLTEDLRVISILSESAESEALLEEKPSRIKIKTSKISRCVVGETIVFDDQYIAEAVKEIYGALHEAGADGDIEYIDLTEVFYIKMYYLDRFLIQFGNWKNAQYKTALFTNVVKELYEDDTGEIDVSETREAIVELYSKY